MTNIEKNAAVDLFVKQNSRITGLWGIYIAATFTAASFSVTEITLTKPALLTLSAGFWAFVVGHIILINQALEINMMLKNEIFDAGSAEDCSYSKIIPILAKTANRPYKSIAIHLFIDVCVTLLIWRAQFNDLFDSIGFFGS